MSPTWLPTETALVRGFHFEIRLLEQAVECISLSTDNGEVLAKFESLRGIEN
jgi:hypothetical protein